jgi:UDP-glucuronate 4-epimerase
VRVLVTGCAGFIGSHLCEKLLAGGHSVTGVDNFTEYYDPDLKFRNLESCLDSGRFRLQRCLVADMDPELARDAELIFHLAAQPGVRGSWGRDFETYVNLNVLNTQSLLESIRHSKNLKRLVYSSSSSVYGQTCAEKVSENHTKAPHSPYGVTKHAAEQLCSLYAANFGLSIISLRLFTVFGPRQRPDMLFSNLISAALAGTPFVLYGDGEMQRDFTSVFDVVNAFLLAAETPVARGAFNIAGGEVVSINTAIRTVEDLAGTRVAIERRQERRGDVQRTSADISEAAGHLGYLPRRTLRNTLGEQIEFMDLLLKSKSALSATAC